MEDLAKELEALKDEYTAAQNDYNWHACVNRLTGARREQMDASYKRMADAHNAAQELRRKYNATINTEE